MIGLFGVIFCKNRGFIILLLSLEMILFGLSIFFGIVSLYLQDPVGHIYVFINTSFGSF